MTPIQDLVTSLSDAFAHSPESGAPIVVTAVDLRLPIESQIREDGALYASLPRGRLATGFDVPHGSIALRLVREVPR